MGPLYDTVDDQQYADFYEEDELNPGEPTSEGGGSGVSDMDTESEGEGSGDVEIFVDIPEYIPINMTNKQLVGGLVKRVQPKINKRKTDLQLGLRQMLIRSKTSMQQGSWLYHPHKNKIESKILPLGYVW